MAISWYVSDMHFHHAKIAPEFGRPFANVEEHDEFIVQRWNDRVKPDDEVLILGDVAFNTGLEKIELLNGYKILIPGNHDQKSIDAYIGVFDDVKGYVFNRNLGIIFSHIPIHPHCLGERWKYNVHGHTHYNHIMRDQIPGTEQTPIQDKRYINICLEQTDFAPLSHDELISRLK